MCVQHLYIKRYLYCAPRCAVEKSVRNFWPWIAFRLLLLLVFLLLLLALLFYLSLSTLYLCFGFCLCFSFSFVAACCCSFSPLFFVFFLVAYYADSVFGWLCLLCLRASVCVCVPVCVFKAKNLNSISAIYNGQ